MRAARTPGWPGALLALFAMMMAAAAIAALAANFLPRPDLPSACIHPTASIAEQCNQHLANHIALEAARWSFFQAIFSGLGVAGLLYSLHLNRRATLLAQQATSAGLQALELARENSRIELRAYVDIASVACRSDTIRLNAGMQPPSYGPGVIFDITLLNAGNTPASEVFVTAKLEHSDRVAKVTTELHTFMTSVSSLSQSGRFSFDTSVFHPSLDLEAYADQPAHFAAIVSMKYIDVFGIAHNNRSTWITDTGRFGPLERVPS